jgi:hypothetical protein
MSAIEHSLRMKWFDIIHVACCIAQEWRRTPNNKALPDLQSEVMMIERWDFCKKISYLMFLCSITPVIETTVSALSLHPLLWTHSVLIKEFVHGQVSGVRRSLLKHEPDTKCIQWVHEYQNQDPLNYTITAINASQAGRNLKDLCPSNYQWSE